jgi:hypothetical protein
MTCDNYPDCDCGGLCDSESWEDDLVDDLLFEDGLG